MEIPSTEWKHPLPGILVPVRRPRFTVGIVVILLAWFSASASKLDFTKPYLVLETWKRSTLEKELNQALAAGYRVILVVPGRGSLVIEKQASREEQYENLLLGDAITLQHAAGRGYRLVPGTPVVARKKGAPEVAQFEYALLEGASDSPEFHEKLAQWSEQRYQVVEMVTADLVLERPVAGGAPAAPTNPGELRGRYKLLATTNTPTMQREINDAVAAGYRPLFAPAQVGRHEGLLHAFDDMIVLLEKSSEPETAYECLFLATFRRSKLEDELNKAAARGFRALPRTFTFVAGELRILAEKRGAASGKYRYRLLQYDPSFETLSTEELAKAARDSYRIIGVNSRFTFLLEKEQSPSDR